MSIGSSCTTQHIVETAFLTSSSLVFATVSVHQEVQTGEPALRGLVHAGICGLFVVLLHTKPRNAVAPLFSAFGMAIGAQAAWVAEWSVLATALAAGAVEALGLVGAFPAIGAYVAIAMARSIPTSLGAVEMMTFVFHSAFACSLIDATGAVQAVVAATLASRAQDPPVALLLGVACVRSCWATLRHTPVRDDPTLVTAHIAGNWPYVVSVGWYSAALLTDAWTCCALDGFATTTRMLHVAAVCASLMYLIPTACDAFAWLKWPLTAFPLVDATVCTYRLVVGPSLPTLYLRAVGAFAVAVCIHTAPVRVDALVATTERTSHSSMINRAAIGMYALVHIAQAHWTAHVEDALAILFHYIIITLSLAWMGIEDMDRLGNQYACVFLAIECATDVGLFALVDRDRPSMALNAACAAFLGWRVHSEHGRANMRYESSLLSFVRTPTVSSAPIAHVEDL